MTDDEYNGLTNRKHWVVASWKPTYEPIVLLGTSEKIQQLLANLGARLKPSQKERAPASRDADLTDDRQIQGNWIHSFYRFAHPNLQEP